MLTIATVTQLIQFIIAPVVMISACGLILNGIVQQHVAVDERLRGMMRERLSLISKTESYPIDEERLLEIDAQVPIIKRRHTQLHNAIMLLYIAIVILVSSMFVIAVATGMDSAPISWAALALFITGTGVMLFAVLVTLFAVSQSLHALYYEVDRVTHLRRRDDKTITGPQQ